MAYKAATVLQDAIVNISANWLKFEQRLSTYGALAAFKDNAPRFIPPSAIENIKKSIRQPEKIPALNKFDVTLTTAPSCDPGCSPVTSAYKAITWAYMGFPVCYVPSENEDNYVTAVEDIALQMRMGWKKVFATLDTNAVTVLETNKSASVATSTNPGVATAAGVYDYSGKPEEFFINAPGLLAINDFDSNGLNDVANSESMATMLRIQTFGANNSQNLQVINPNGWTHYLSNRVAPGANQELHYLFPDGVLGVYNWVDPDSRAGRTAGNKSWGTIQDPMFGFDWSVYTVADCVDNTTVPTGRTMAGNTRAYMEKKEIGAWFAFITDYSSDTSTPIIKVTFNPA